MDENEDLLDRVSAIEKSLKRLRVQNIVLLRLCLDFMPFIDAPTEELARRNTAAFDQLFEAMTHHNFDTEQQAETMRLLTGYLEVIVASRTRTESSRRKHRPDT